MTVMFRRLLHDETGTVPLEYALLLAVVGVGIGAAFVGCGEWLAKLVGGFEGHAEAPPSGEAKVVGCVGE